MKLRATIALLTLTLCNISAFSADSVSTLEVKKVNAKCYVELVGGGETISLWLAEEQKISLLVNEVIGQEITVIGKKRKAIIYKAKECVLEEDEFKNIRARVLDAAQPK